MANCAQCGRQLPGLTFGKKICQWCVQHEAAQRGEDSPAQRIEPTPWAQQRRSNSTSMIVTQTILALNVMVFVAMAMAGASVTNPNSADLLRFGANFGPYTMAGQWWRLLTCVFVHIGIIHIALNMWCLWGLGRLAEAIYDHWTYASVYLITGVSASIASLIREPDRLSAGASGAIFGIAGALIASLYLGEFTMPKPAVSGLLQSVVKFAGINLVFGAMAGHTDNAAHVGGLVSGLILGALISRVAPQRDDIGRRVSVLLVGVVLAYAGALWLHYSNAHILHESKGLKLLDQKQTDQAIPVHYELARAYFLKGDFASASSELKRVTELDPTDQRAFFSLGMASLESNHPDQARASFAQLLKLNPSSAGAHFGLGLASASQENYSDALVQYKRTVALDAKYAGVYQEMGNVQLHLKQYDDALASFLQQKKDGDSPDNETGLADTYDAKGMHQEAAQARKMAKAFKNQH